jgi:hypothetical protein
MVLGFFPGGKVSVELPRSGSSIVPKNCVHRTAEVQQFYGQLTLDTWKVSIELPRSAVLWMLFWPAGKVSIELPRSGSSLIPENSVHRTTKVLSSIHTKKVCSSMDPPPSKSGYNCGCNWWVARYTLLRRFIWLSFPLWKRLFIVTLKNGLRHYPPTNSKVTLCRAAQNFKVPGSTDLEVQDLLWKCMISRLIL